MFIKTFGARTLRRPASPFNRQLVKRPSFLPNTVDIQESNKVEVDPPRFIKLGIQLSPIDGTEIGDFFLPFDTREHEPACVIIGESGSGKSTCLSRLLSELSFQYSRSVTLLDFKNQYRFASMKNDDPKHIKILEGQGERTRGINKTRCFLPIHIIDRWGEDYCRANYGFTDTWKMSINDCDAAGLLMLGQKESEGRGYVNILDAAMAVIRRRDGKLSLDSLIAELESLLEDQPGSKRSVDALLTMLDALVKTRVLADKGNGILELMHPPRKPGLGGDFHVFNLSGAGPDDIQTKGMLVNILNGICHTLKTNLQVQPILAIEEASAFFSKDSPDYLRRALSQLHFVVGRTEGIFRIYVYQKRTQVPLDLLDDKGTNIIIETTNNFTLGNGQQLFGAGYAKVHIRNMTFMASDIFLIKVLPPKCKVIS